MNKKMNIFVNQSSNQFIKSKRKLNGNQILFHERNTGFKYPAFISAKWLLKHYKFFDLVPGEHIELKSKLT